MQTELIPRHTVESIVTLRNVALDKYSEVYNALVRASSAIDAAREAANLASPGLTSFNYHSDHDREHFLYTLEVADHDKFTKRARRLTDIDVWSYLIQMTDLESLMDKQEKEKLRTSLRHDPPEVTVENVYATLQQFAQDAHLIWQRGLANSFANLDRRFRSHDGWKLGNRIILSYAFDERGNWNWNRNHEDTLIDVERVFYQLDGDKPPPVHYGIVGAIKQERRGVSGGPRQSELETEFFKIRIYKNGNCHLWFTRDDLVEKANKVLAQYYGEVLADSTDEGEEEDLFKAKRTPARYFGHFPTPEHVAKDLLHICPLNRTKDKPPLTVLEPSAGAGNIARQVAEYNPHKHVSDRDNRYGERCTVVDCVEIQAHLAAELRQSGLYRRVVQGDFLEHRPDPGNLYDRVIMNPPFDRERDIDHVMHAMRFLKPDGCLVAIMSAGTEFRETRKARAFRDRMAKLNAMWRDLPPGSFASVGTNVNTRILRVYNDGHQQYSW